MPMQNLWFGFESIVVILGAIKGAWFMIIVVGWFLPIDDKKVQKA